jgi:predicted short-subunit dehydrogenase-like oxidoreductase (DUF2520 family)
MRELERDSKRLGDGAIRVPIAVVGPGRVGRSLARAAINGGLEASLAGRRDAVAVCERSEVALLCVPDDEIEAACETIAVAVPPLRLVGHVSGATPLTALASARRRGAEAFCLHPLQTVPDGATSLSGAACAVSGSTHEARETAAALARHIGMRPFALDDESRAAYHAAASMASNFLVTLEWAAERVGGVDRELLAPLVRATVDNWAAHGPERALTGPIARGDDETVERQRDAVARRAPEHLPLFDALAGATRALAAGVPA